MSRVMIHFDRINNLLSTPLKEENWKRPGKDYNQLGLDYNDGFHLLVDNGGDITLWDGKERLYLITFNIPARVTEKLLILKRRLKPIFSYLTDELLDELIEMIKFFVENTRYYKLYLRGSINQEIVVDLHMASYYYNKLTSENDSIVFSKRHISVYSYVNDMGTLHIPKAIEEFITTTKTINQELGMTK